MATAFIGGDIEIISIINALMKMVPNLHFDVIIVSLDLEVFLVVSGLMKTKWNGRQKQLPQKF